MKCLQMSLYFLAILVKLNILVNQNIKYLTAIACSAFMQYKLFLLDSEACVQICFKADRHTVNRIPWTHGFTGILWQIQMGAKTNIGQQAFWVTPGAHHFTGSQGVYGQVGLE